uniref:Uncharacterized protein LOC108950678 n=1 Tax=Phallusia mammillata TaxID=59560 RepID=A0A6F9DK44_9ASCI|nr:uncharacterized protein LOC108950678 [Phallusia mammillata]
MNLLFVFTIAFAPFVLAKPRSFQLCHDSLSKGEYYIPKPMACKKNTIAPQKGNRLVKVFNPSRDQIPIEVHMCQMYKTSYESHFYFFGGKFHTKSTVSSPAPTAGTCEEWHRTQNAPLVGRLIERSDTLWSTMNKVNVEYKWPTKNVGFVNNAVLTKSTIYYDPVNKRMKSALGILSNCNVHKGFCTVGTRTFIWSVPKNVDCATTTPMGIHQMIAHHEADTGKLYRLEIPSLGLSIHQQLQCSQQVTACYSQKAICTGGIILVPMNCTEESLTFRLHTKKPNNSRYVGLFINEATDAIQDSIENMTSYIHYVECQIQSLLTTVYALLSRQYPGEILSQVLGGQRAAVTVADLMTEITCETINGTIIHNVQYGDFYATRPLIEYTNSRGNRSIGQLYRDGFVYPNVKFVENYVPGRVFSFEVDDSFLVYDNYTLTYVDSKVHYITPTLTPVHEKKKNEKEPLDFQSFLDDFPKSNNGFEDLTSMLMTLTEAKLTHDKLTQYIQSNTEPTVEVDSSFLTDKLEAATKNIFLHVISSITSPFLSFVFMIALFLACFWDVALTGWAIKYYEILAVDVFKTSVVTKFSDSVGDDKGLDLDNPAINNTGQHNFWCL